MGIVFDQSLNTTDSPTFNSLKTDTILSDAANLSVSNRMTINAGHQTNLAVMTLNCAAGTGGLKLQNGSRSFQIGNNLNHTRPHFVRITNIGLRFSHGGAVSNGEAPFLFSGDLNSANSTSAVIGITTGGDGGLLEGLNSSGVRTSLLRSDGSFESYNTYTDASNYERGVFKWDSNVLTIGTEALGTGSTRDITITSNRQLNLKSTSATYLYNPGSPSAYLWIANFSLKPNTANDWDLGEPNNLLRFNNIYGRTLYAYTTYIQSSAGATRWVLDGDNNLISQNVTGGPHLGSTPPYSFVGDTSTGLDTDGSGTLIAIANADTFEQRNGTTAQTFNVYNTYTDASNYERGYLKWEGSILKLGNESLGTGVERSLYIESSVDLRLSCGSGDTISFYPANTNSFGMNASRFYSVSEQYLGSSSFRFGNVYSVDGDFTGTVNIGTGSSSNVGGMILSSNGGTHTIDVSSNVLEIRSYNVIKMIDGASTVFQTSGSAVTAASCKFPRGAHFSALGANYLTSVFQGYSGQNRDLSEWRDSSDAKLLTIGATGDLSLYNTYTDASNYERGVFKWDSNALTIGTESLGTGTGRAVRFIVNGVDYGGISTNGRWQLGAGAASSSSVNIGGDNIIHFKDSATAFIDTGVSSPLQLRPQGVVAMRLNTDQSIDVYQRMTVFGTDVASSSTIPPISITKTYNQTGTAGSTDLLINRTETALGSGDHYFADFQVGGVSKVSIENDGTVEMYDNVIHFHEAGGQIRFQRWTSIPTQFGYIGRDVANGPIVYDSGSWSGAGHTFAGVGTFRQELQTTYFANAAPKLVFQSSSGSSGDFTGNSPFSFDSGYAGGTAGFVIKNAAARKVEVDSNGDLFVFNSYTDASNYERGVIKWDTNVLTIGTEALGTGTVRDIEFVGGNFGIGIAPAILFDVYGTGNQYGRLKSTSDMTLIIDSGVSNESGLRFRRGGNNKAVVYLGASDILYFDVGGTDALTIDSLQQTTILHTGVSSSGTDNPFTITPTYNQTGTAGSTDLLINRTETAVGSGDQNLMDLQVGGTSKFKVNNAGMVTTAGGNGSGTAGGLMLGNSIGWISRGTGSVELASGSAEYIEMASDGITLRTGNSFGWSANNNPQDGSGPRLWENTTDERIELRRGTTALGFAVANTWTDASNSEFGVFKWDTNVLTIGTEALGTGVERSVEFIGADFTFTGNSSFPESLTSSDAAHSDSQRFGSGASVTGTRGHAFGHNASAVQYGVALGYSAIAGDRSVAIGHTAVANVNSGIAIGNQASVSGAGGVAVGDGSTAATDGQAFGRGATAAARGIAIGKDAVADYAECVLGGPNRPITDVYIGAGKTGSTSNPTVTIQPSYSTINDTAGTDLILGGGKSIGSGVGGDIIFKIAGSGASGSSINSQVTVATITSAGIDVTGNATFSGQIVADNGTNALPGYVFSNSSSTGFVSFSANVLGISFGGANKQYLTASEVRIGSGMSFGFSSSGSPSAGSADVSLYRDAANILAQRNGTTAQAFNLYNTWTDSSNYERGFHRWTSNVYRIGVESLGTGSTRYMELWAAGTINLACDVNQNISYKNFFPSDSTINLGRVNNRWNDGYITNIYSYNSYTDASNYERGVFKWDTNRLTIGTEALGTGSDRAIRITRRSDTEYYELVNAQHTFVANSKTMRYTGTALYPTGLTDLGDPSNSRSWPNAYIENIFSYNSYTDASNYERGVFKWDSNVLTIGTEALGTGTDRAVEFIGSAFDFSSTVTVPQLDVGPTGAKIDYAANKLYVIGYTGTLFRNQADTASGDAFQFTGNTNIQLTAASGSQRYIGIDAEINQSGTAGYDLIGGNVTETATGSGTKNLIDLKVGGSSKFSVTNAGKVHSNAGTSVISYESQFANYGIGFNNNGEACAVINSSAKTKIGWNVITSGNVGLTGTAGYNMSADVILERDAANTLALRNGANNQRLNIYDSYTDGSNYVRGFLRGSGSGYFQLGTEALGTGVEQNLSIMTSGTERIRISPSGRINLFKTITPITAVAGVDLGLVNSPFDLAFINQIYSYNSYTDASNYERGVFKWDSNVLTIGTESLGTGAARVMKFDTGWYAGIQMETQSFWLYSHTQNSNSIKFGTGGNHVFGATASGAGSVGFYWTDRNADSATSIGGSYDAMNLSTAGAKIFQWLDLNGIQAELFVGGTFGIQGGIGIHGVTPPSQSAHIADVSTGTDAAYETAINALIAVMEAHGLTATS